ncbi:MAG: hypothetical protein EBX95_06695 [Acidimicrobiia bacterium]|nr:hypothetical protein [Acidimicrobiia bacterium]
MSGWNVRWMASTGSTNDDLLAAGRAGAPDKTVLIADHQTAGKGRLDRRWETPANIGWAPEGAASLLGESGRRVSREEVMAVMLSELDELLSLSPEQLHDRYRRRLSTLNREVRVELPNSTFVEGRALDVESDGRLVVLDSCGATHRLDVGDIVHLR